MRNTSYKFVVLFLILAVSCSIGDKISPDDERVVLVSPVLASHRTSKAKPETAKEFSVLMLLAGENKTDVGTPQVAEDRSDKHPIYVQVSVFVVTAMMQRFDPCSYKGSNRKNLILTKTEILSGLSI